MGLDAQLAAHDL